MNIHLLEEAARDRIAEALAVAAHWRLLESLAPARLPLRVRAGEALIRIGHRLVGSAPAPSGEPQRLTA
jgi:precorrin-6B methylase 1